MKGDYHLSMRPVFLTEMRGLGGGETSLLNLLIDLVSSGNRPLLCCPDGDLYRECARLNIELHALTYPDVHLGLGFIPHFSLATVAKIIQILKDHNAHVVHVESLLALYYGGLAARLSRIPLVATYHGYWPLDVSLNRLFLRRFCRRIYPVSKSMENEISPVFRHPRDRLLTIPLGVNMAFLEALPDRDSARRQLGLPLDRHIILQVARFQPIKGQQYLLHALRLLVGRFEGFSPLVVFVGGVLDPPLNEELSYRAHIESLASQENLRGYVQICGHRKDVANFIRAADVVVCPSEFESFGMAIIEAMAVGTPVIATNAGGPSEIIEHERTGLLVPPRDGEALAYAIKSIIDRPDRGLRIAKMAREVVVDRYGPHKRCDSLLADYEKLVNRGRIAIRGMPT